MRVTNQMMINSSIANIQANKSQINTMDTQLSTQKKINKPSDDPIIAIRALRLRSSLDQVTQYVGKNIPDASSWLSVTQDALDQGYDIVYQLYGYCNQGASDSYSSSERNTIIESLDELRILIIYREMSTTPEDMYLRGMLQISRLHTSHMRRQQMWIILLHRSLTGKAYLKRRYTLMHILMKISLTLM